MLCAGDPRMEPRRSNHHANHPILDPPPQDLSSEELQLPTHQLNTDGLYVCALSVVEKARRRGVGKALMGAAEEIGRAQGCSFLLLHVELSALGPLALYQDTLGYEILPAIKENMEFTSAINLGPEQGAPLNYLMRKELHGEAGGVRGMRA